MIARKAAILAALALSASSCGFGGIFAQDQQGEARERLLGLIAERGVDWADLPDTWEVVDIREVGDSEVEFDLFIDRTLFVTGCVSLEQAAELKCFDRKIPQPFMLLEEGVEGFCGLVRAQRAVLFGAALVNDASLLVSLPHVNHSGIRSGCVCLLVFFIAVLGG